MSSRTTFRLGCSSKCECFAKEESVLCIWMWKRSWQAQQHTQKSLNLSNLKSACLCFHHFPILGTESAKNGFFQDSPVVLCQEGQKIFIHALNLLLVFRIFCVFTNYRHLHSTRPVAIRHKLRQFDKIQVLKFHLPFQGFSFSIIVIHCSACQGVLWTLHLLVGKSGLKVFCQWLLHAVSYLSIYLQKPPSPKISTWVLCFPSAKVVIQRFPLEFFQVQLVVVEGDHLNV